MCVCLYNVYVYIHIYYIYYTCTHTHTNTHKHTQTGQQSAAQAGAVAPTAEAVDMMDDDEPLIVAQNLVSFVERLDDELYLSLRLLDNHSAEFLKRLQDIAPILSLAHEVQDYYENLGQQPVAAR